MALRKLAAEASGRMGLSIAPATQAPANMMGVWSRAYAKGAVSLPKILMRALLEDVRLRWGHLSFWVRCVASLRVR
jgi:hypothetical protein